MSTNMFTAADEGSTLSRLHRRLAAAAEDDGLLDIAYRTVDTPVGTLLLAATEIGLLRVAFAVEGHDDVLSALAQRVSPRILASPARLDDAARQIEQYFDRDRTTFDLPFDLRLAQGFRRTVVDHLREIDYGRRESYGAVATAVGSPGAVRAVGTACARNPLPVIIPCHRVVRSDGSAGQYAGGAAAKLTLLNFEAA